MPIDFAKSEPGTLGVEWELALVESDTLELTGRASEVLDVLGAEPKGPIRAEYLVSMIELVSGVHTSVSGAIDELRGHLERVVAVAEPLGLAVIGAGSHPFTRGEDVAVVAKPSYDVVRERNAWWGRRMTICGTHVHLGVGDRSAAMPLMRGLADASPVLIALATSSPFYEGADTGFASQRTMLFRQLETNGLPPQLDDWGAFEQHVAALKAAGIADSPSAIRWDVRPAPAFGTVEMRSPDASPTLRELGCVAAWARCLGEELLTDPGAGWPPLPAFAVRENKWRAARYGCDAELITTDGQVPLRELAEEALDRLASVADRLGCRAELESTRELLAGGTSAERQRRAAAASGGSLRAVVRHLIAETRSSL